MSKGMKLLIGIGVAIVATMLFVLAACFWLFRTDETGTQTTLTPTAGVVTSTPIPDKEQVGDKTDTTDNMTDNLPATDETVDAGEEIQPTVSPSEPTDIPNVPGENETEADDKTDDEEVGEVTPTTAPEVTDMPMSALSMI